jgi:hypothetical protein
VVALDVSLLIRRPGYFLDGRDAATISTEIDTRVDEVRLKNNCLSETSLGRNVLGIITFARVLAHDRSENRHLACQKLAMIIHTDPNQADHRLAENLYSLLFLKTGNQKRGPMRSANGCKSPFGFIPKTA